MRTAVSRIFNTTERYLLGSQPTEHMSQKLLVDFKDKLKAIEIFRLPHSTSRASKSFDRQYLKTKQMTPLHGKT